MIQRDYELTPLHEVRGMLNQVFAFLQGLANERDVQLFEVTNTAVDELGAATGSCLREIGTFNQQGAIAAVAASRCTEAGGAATNDEEVKALPVEPSSRKMESRSTGQVSFFQLRIVPRYDSRTRPVLRAAGLSLI